MAFPGVAEVTHALFFFSFLSGFYKYLATPNVNVRSGMFRYLDDNRKKKPSEYDRSGMGK